MKLLSELLHIFFCLLIVVLAILSIIEYAQSADSHLLASGQQKVIDEHGVCRVVTNTTAKTIYIPTKTAAEWSSFYNNASGSITAPACAGCTLDGANVAHGASRTFYLTTRSCYGTCGAISQSRNCYNGALDGSASYSKASCPSPTCASCTTASVNWTTSSFTCSASATGGSHSTTRNVSDGAAPNVGNATFQCDDGTWGKTSGSCGGASCATATLGWTTGSYSCSTSVAAVAHGQSRTSSDSTSPYIGSATFNCNNGSWSKTSGSCQPSTCSLPWGGTINDGQSVTAYQSSRSCGQSCTAIDQVRTCSNGTLSGSSSYNKVSCPAEACANCPATGVCPTTPHGGHCTSYQYSSVPYGQTCFMNSSATPCDDGSWDTDGEPIRPYASCSVQTCSCPGKTFSWSDGWASCSAYGVGRPVNAAIYNVPDNDGVHQGTLRVQCSNTASGCAWSTVSGTCEYVESGGGGTMSCAQCGAYCMANPGATTAQCQAMCQPPSCTP